MDEISRIIARALAAKRRDKKIIIRGGEAGWTWVRTRPVGGRDVGFLGIDPGGNGGLALVTSFGDLARTGSMPKRTRVDRAEVAAAEVPRRRRKSKAPSEADLVPDVLTLADMMRSAAATVDRLHVAVERVWGRGGNGAQSNFTFGMRYQVVFDAFVVAQQQAPNMDLVTVPAQTWQRIMIPDAKGADSKTASLAKAWAMHRTPEAFVATRRETTPKDGISDAILIAHWMRQHMSRQNIISEAKEALEAGDLDDWML